MVEFLCYVFAGLALLVMAQWLLDRIDAGALKNAAARAFDGNACAEPIPRL